MSVDFTFVQAALSQSIYSVMVKIESDIEKLGFVKSSPIYRVGLDNRCVFEENEKESISGVKFSELSPNHQKELQSWSGLAVEFHSSEYTFYLLVCNHDQFLNVFVEISGKLFERLVADKGLNDYRLLINTVAVSIKSKAGFGTFELPFAPVPLEKIVPSIFRNSEGIPSLLGIIHQTSVDEHRINSFIDNKFNISTPIEGFVFLTHSDLNG